MDNDNDSVDSTTDADPPDVTEQYATFGTIPYGKYESLTALKEALQETARGNGYELVILKGNYNKARVLYKYHFACKRYGKWKDKIPATSRKRPQRTTFKCGCRMRIIIASCDPNNVDGPWEARKSIEEHNHPPDDPKNLPGHRRRDLSSDVYDKILRLSGSGAASKDIETILLEENPDALVTLRDIKNILARANRPDPAKRYIIDMGGISLFGHKVRKLTSCLECNKRHNKVCRAHAKHYFV